MIGRNATWPWTVTPVFLRANDKRMNGSCRQKIKHSVFYGTNLQFFDSLEKKDTKIHCRWNYTLVFSRGTEGLCHLIDWSVWCCTLWFVSNCMNDIVCYYLINMECIIVCCILHIVLYVECVVLYSKW